MRLSVVILTYNAEQTIGATLASLGTLSDDVHVVDSYSEDATLRIARSAGARIVQHPFEDYGRQRNWAIETLDLKGDWELHLDADERLSPALAEEIHGALEDAPAAVAGFYLPRLVRFLGQPLRHGGMYPIYHLRLFRRGAGRCESRLYDQHFFVAGATRTLAHPMIDDIRGPLEVWKERHRRWARLEAEQLTRPSAPVEGVIAGRFHGDPVERKRAWRGLYQRLPLFVRPCLLFLYRFVWRLGMLDGRRGWIFYAYQTFWFRWQIDRQILLIRLGRGDG